MECRHCRLPRTVARLGMSWLAAVVVIAQPSATSAADGSADLVRWFQATEQALMDSIAPGDKTVWSRRG
jgi:hypothetical protein